MAMSKSLVCIRILRCANSPLNVAGGRCRSMTTKRKGSLYPSSIYPRLESVDLGDDGDDHEEVAKGINFTNHQEVFRNKTTWELARALAVLKLCSINKLVDNSQELMRWVERVCGRRVLRLVFKPTFYDQFVGGESCGEIRAVVRRLAEAGMRAMLAASLEEDVGGGSEESVYDSNCQRIIESLEIATAEDTPSPMVQLKLTGLIKADLVVLLGNKYTSSTDKMELIQAIAQGLSGNEVNANLLTDTLDTHKLEHLNKAVQRLKNICEEARGRRVKVLVDAEYTYLNPGLSLLTLAAVSAFNKDSPLIWNTYQCYLKDANEKLEEEMDLVLSKMNACFGAKIVRGAYIEQERTRAEKLKYPDPICEDYEATGKNYNNLICQLLEKKSELGSRCQFIIATHNEESIKLAIERIIELGLDKIEGGVSFGQLYGMCDQVTRPLADAGFAVYKSIPFGTVEEVIPYLARRAVENRSVIAGARKERTLISKEFWRRMGKTLTCRSWETPRSETPTLDSAK